MDAFRPVLQLLHPHQQAAAVESRGREMMTVMKGAPPPVFRPDQSVPDHSHGSGAGASYMEKRQLFLRSYHFSRKKSRMEKVRCSAVRVGRLIWVRLRAARRLPRLLWYGLRCAWYGYRYSSYGRSRRRSRFQRLGLGVFRPTAICGGDWSC